MTEADINEFEQTASALGEAMVCVIGMAGKHPAPDNILYCRAAIQIHNAMETLSHTCMALELDHRAKAVSPREACTQDTLTGQAAEAV